MFENKEDAKMYFKKHSFEICAGKLTFKLPSDGTDPKVEIHETVLNNKSVEYSEGVGILDSARWAKFAERWDETHDAGLVAKLSEVKNEEAKLAATKKALEQMQQQ